MKVVAVATSGGRGRACSEQRRRVLAGARALAQLAHRVISALREVGRLPVRSHLHTMAGAPATTSAAAATSTAAAAANAAAAAAHTTAPSNSTAAAPAPAATQAKIAAADVAATRALSPAAPVPRPANNHGPRLLRRRHLSLGQAKQGRRWRDESARGADSAPPLSTSQDRPGAQAPKLSTPRTNADFGGGVLTAAGELASKPPLPSKRCGSRSWPSRCAVFAAVRAASLNRLFVIEPPSTPLAFSLPPASLRSAVPVPPSLLAPKCGLSCRAAISACRANSAAASRCPSAAGKVASSDEMLDASGATHAPISLPLWPSDLPLSEPRYDGDGVD
eukprot:3345670-Pleurochrysis_carterae.AAC.2